MSESKTTGFSKVIIKDDREVLIECIKTSRVLAELHAIMTNRFVPPVVSAYSDMQAVRSVSRSVKGSSDLETMFLAGVAKEKDFGTDIHLALFHADIFRMGSAREPTLKNICEIHSEFIRGEVEHPNKKYGPVSINLPKDVSNGLEHLLKDDKKDELLRALGAFLLFEMNHPFGKNQFFSLLVFHMFLHSFGLLEDCSLCLLPDESYLEKNRELISEIKKGGDPKNWFIFMLGRVRDAAFNIIRKAFSINDYADDIRDRYQDMPIYSEQLLKLLCSNIFIKGADVIEAGIAERVTAMKYLNTLEILGLLKSFKIGRERIFKNTELSKILIGN